MLSVTNATVIMARAFSLPMNYVSKFTQSLINQLLCDLLFSLITSIGHHRQPRSLRFDFIPITDDKFLPHNFSTSRTGVVPTEKLKPNCHDT